MRCSGSADAPTVRSLQIPAETDAKRWNVPPAARGFGEWHVPWLTAATVNRLTAGDGQLTAASRRLLGSATGAWTAGAVIGAEETVGPALASIARAMGVKGPGALTAARPTWTPSTW